MPDQTTPSDGRLTDDQVREIADADPWATYTASIPRQLAAEVLELRALRGRVTAMVDHGLHSEDPDEHDCAASPCWAVRLRQVLGIEETDDV